MEYNSPTATRSEIIPNSPMTFHGWIGRWKARLDSQMVVPLSPGKSIGQNVSDSEFAKDSLWQMARVIHVSSLPTPSTSSVQESMEDMVLGTSSFLISKARESTASAAPEEGHWSNIKASLSRIGSNHPNWTSDRLQDVKILAVYVCEGGLQWSNTLGSLQKLEPDNPNLAFQRLQNIDAVASERISRLAKLEPDWDGYGGEPITQEAIEKTASLLTIIQGLTGGNLPSPFIAPLPDGGLELEWELDSGVELTLIVPSGGGETKYLLDVPTVSGEIEESEGLLLRDASLSELVAELN